VAGNRIEEGAAKLLSVGLLVAPTLAFAAKVLGKMDESRCGRVFRFQLGKINK